MTKVTVKSAEVAKAMVAAIMPNATPEKSNYFVLGGGKVQNRFFEDVNSGLSYCEGYEKDCETLELINFFDKFNNVVATIELNPDGADDAENGIEEICKALGIEKVKNAAEVESLSMLDKSDQWEIEANAILEKTVFAALKGGHSIYLFTQENIDSNAVSKGHFLDVRDVKFPTAFFSFMFLDSGEFSFSHSAFSGTRDLAVYETKDQFQTVAIKLAEAIQRGDEEFIFPTVEEVTADNINAELIACIDDYSVDVDAAAEVEIENAEKAAEENAAAKVVFLQELKTKMNGKIKIESAIFLDSLLDDVFGSFEKNELKSENAGYEFRENADGDWLSFLGDRVEINLASGETFNVWIDKIGYYAEKTSLPFMGFALDKAIDEGDVESVKFWLEVIEYRLETKEDAEIWRKILKTEYYLAMLANLELIACIDDYATDADAAAEVEIENAEKAAEVEEVKIRKAEFKKFCDNQNFVRNVFSNCGKFSIKLAKANSENDIYEGEDGLWSETLTPGLVDEISWFKLEYNGKIGLFVNYVKFAEYNTDEEVRKAIISLGAAVKRGKKIFTFPPPRKSIINWDEAYKDLRLAEIFSLQREFKKLLKLGELKRAAVVFENIQLLFWTAA